jgi:hypothetical protein
VVSCRSAAGVVAQRVQRQSHRHAGLLGPGQGQGLEQQVALLQRQVQGAERVHLDGH